VIDPELALAGVAVVAGELGLKTASNFVVAKLGAMPVRLADASDPFAILQLRRYREAAPSFVLQIMVKPDGTVALGTPEMLVARS
jgi:hypothetical protein